MTPHNRVIEHLVHLMTDRTEDLCEAIVRTSFIKYVWV